MIKYSINKWDNHFIDIAKLCSNMSKDPSTKVGSAIKCNKDKSIVSTGYNGLPKWMPDIESVLHNREHKYKYIIHAEENAINFANKRNVELSDCTIYTTMLPCERCYNLIKNNGIKRIVTVIPSKDQISRWGKSWEKVKEMSKHDNIIIDYL